MDIKSLLLIWRDEKSSLYFHVGTLTYDGYVYKFEYTHQSKVERRVNDAINHGYTLHPAFPRLTKKYESEKLFPAFARRIPSRNRIDYEEVLKQLSLPKEADQMNILRATRGIVGNNPYFFDEPLRLVNNNMLTNCFYISGMRYSDLPENWYSSIQKGEELILEPDLNNTVDPNAVKISTKNKVRLGYVPGVFAKAIGALLERNVKMNVIIDEINPTYTPQWWLRVNFKSTLEQEQSTKDILELDGLVLFAA